MASQIPVLVDLVNHDKVLKELFLSIMNEGSCDVLTPLVHALHLNSTLQGVKLKTYGSDETFTHYMMHHKELTFDCRITWKGFK